MREEKGRDNEDLNGNKRKQGKGDDDARKDKRKDERENEIQTFIEGGFKRMHNYIKRTKKNKR